LRDTLSRIKLSLLLLLLILLLVQPLLLLLLRCTALCVRAAQLVCWCAGVCVFV
jgi:hypothetical protein